MKRVINKNILFFHYQQYDFPSDLVTDDASKKKNLIFNDTGAEPVLMNKNFKSLIEFKSVYLSRFSNDNKRYYKPFNQIITDQKETNDRKHIKTNDNENNDEKSNKNNDYNNKTQSNNDIINQLEIITNAKPYQHSIHKTNAFSITFNKKQQSSILSIERNKQFEINTSFKQKLLSDNSEVLTQIKNPNLIKAVIDEAINQLDDEFLSKDIKVVNIEKIYKINQRLNYNKKDPLWYIFHPIGKSSFGPLSSLNIEELYNDHKINGECEIRFIDIYSIKNIEPFKYFRLKEVERSDFINRIVISPKVNQVFNSMINYSN